MFRRLFLILVALVVVDQLAQHFLLSSGELLGRRVAPFDPPLFAPAQRASLERVRSLVEGRGPGPPGAALVPFDAELGWCPPPGSGQGEFRYDWAGSRIGSRELPREKQAGVRRIVAVGCSYTHGDEVLAQDSWAALVDSAQGFELGNLAFGAYGLDQALMRLRRDGLRLAPDEVWMGFLPAAATRVGTLYRPVLRHWSPFIAFKPRFVLEGDSDQLRLIPNPARTRADIPRLLDDQEAFLAALSEHDLWVRRASWAYLPRGSHWTHYLTTTRLGLTVWERSRRDPGPWLRDARSEIRRVLRAVVLAAAAAGEAEGVRFRLLVLPAKFDLDHCDAQGRGYWASFAEELRGAGIEVHDLSRELLAARERGVELWQPGGHYSPQGHQVVAEALLAALD